MKNHNIRWKSSSTRSWRLCNRGSNTNSNFQPLNIPSWVGPHEVLQSRLINTVYHSLVKNNKGEGRGLKRDGGGLINFLPLRKGVLIREGEHIWEGDLEDLQQFRALWDDNILQGFIFTIAIGKCWPEITPSPNYSSMSLTGRVFFLSPRPLLKKEKIRDRMLSYLTLYLGIVPCLQGLSRFSKHIGGWERIFRNTQRERNNFAMSQEYPSH